MATRWENPKDDPLGLVADALREGNFDDALALIRSANSLTNSRDRGRASAFEIIALAEVKDDDRITARSLLQNVVQDHREDKELLLALAIELSEHCCYSDASDVLRQLCQTYPTESLCWYNLGLVLERQNEIDEAISKYQESIKFDAKFSPAHVNRARCLERDGRLAEAADQFRQYLSLEPTDDFHWVSLGIVCSNLENFDGAYEAFSRPLEIDPSSVTAWFNRGITASRRSDREVLEECVLELDRGAPNDWRTPAMPANLDEMDGKIWQAWEHWSESIESAAGRDEDHASRPEADNPHDDYNQAEPMAVDSSLQFTVRNELLPQRDSLIGRVFERRLFASFVLASIADATGRRSSNGHLYRVMVEGLLRDPSQFKSFDIPPSAVICLRVYQLLAESDDEAGKLAVEFDQKISDATNQKVVEIDRLENASRDDVALGVIWMSGTHCAPADSP